MPYNADFAVFFYKFYGFLSEVRDIGILEGISIDEVFYIFILFFF